MMDWIARLLGRKSSSGERQAQASENSVERLEDVAIDQQKRLDSATKRVSKAVEQVRHVEDLARRRNAP
jgi:hypothetical protein